MITTQRMLMLSLKEYSVNFTLRGSNSTYANAKFSSSESSRAMHSYTKSQYTLYLSLAVSHINLN